ncbi:hypothetical protein MIDIC_460015 [Alphaproteobacteria bacterium]
MLLDSLKFHKIVKLISSCVIISLIFCIFFNFNVIASEDIEKSKVKNVGNVDDKDRRNSSCMSDRYGDVLEKEYMLELNNRVLPTATPYNEKDGCYIVCYSQTPRGNGYKVDQNEYIVGQIRIQGAYDREVCQPQNYEENDLSAENDFQDLCEKTFPKFCKDKSCWVTGESGQWIHKKCEGG